MIHADEKSLRLLTSGKAISPALASSGLTSEVKEAVRRSFFLNRRPDGLSDILRPSMAARWGVTDTDTVRTNFWRIITSVLHPLVAGATQQAAGSPVQPWR